MAVYDKMRRLTLQNCSWIVWLYRRESRCSISPFDPTRRCRYPPPASPPDWSAMYSTIPALPTLRYTRLSRYFAQYFTMNPRIFETRPTAPGYRLDLESFQPDLPWPIPIHIVAHRGRALSLARIRDVVENPLNLLKAAWTVKVSR